MPLHGPDRLAVVLDALPDGLVLVNDNGTVVSANATAVALFEAPGTALVGRGLLDLLPDYDWRLTDGRGHVFQESGRREQARPRRMTARRTDGDEFTAEVHSTALEGGGAPDPYGYDRHGDGRLLMLVVRDVTGVLDAEAGLASSRRQTATVLRAVTEGVIGTDAEGRIVLVNPAAARMLGYRAGRLGGQELHSLILHTRADGEPYPFEESPLADTLRSGRKHRVRGQVVWAQDGTRIPVDMTTAPVHEEGRIAGVVMTFTDRRPDERLAREHAAELAEHAERHAAALRRHEDGYQALADRHAQLTAAVSGARHGQLEEIRASLAGLAADDAGHLWPEAGRQLGRLAAGCTRLTACLDGLLDYQRFADGEEEPRRGRVEIGRVVDAAVHRSGQLMRHGRARFAVHTPPIEAEVDPEGLTTALAHLLADVADDGHDGYDGYGHDDAGADVTGVAVPVGADAGEPSTVVVAAQRGDTVRIEVRGPYAGGDPVHQAVVRGIVGAHGGVVQRYEVPGTNGSTYVVEVPLAAPSATAGRPPAADAPSGARALPAQRPGTPGHRRRRARHADTGADTDGRAVAVGGALRPTGRRRGRPVESAAVSYATGAPEHSDVGVVTFLDEASADAPGLTPVRALPAQTFPTGSLFGGDTRSTGVPLPAEAPAVPSPAGPHGDRRLALPGPALWPAPAGADLVS
ncbi:PAS domain-containing protein [Streptomyces sp. AC627_RSS907]|uniref:PAS domain-containing protein n=1 Tax=Streptomyces sp. AC627_RSS907 TaxID=2823684 RepID=UPI0020B753BA|nr:PAS domain-containing protein [Streptomyces sp. AC627_RSS907]